MLNEFIILRECNMFISNYNRLACKLIESYNFITAPQIVILFGLKGLGKTILLKKIFDKMIKTDYKTLLIDAEKFATKYAFAAQTGQLRGFRQEMRSCNLLLIDNIDTLKGKKRSIEELFHTYEGILAKGGKVVISFCGDQLSYDFLGERFASRLKCGLGIPLSEPTDQEVEQFIYYYLKKKSHPDLDISAYFSSLPKNLHKITEHIDSITHNLSGTEPEILKTSFVKRSIDYEVRLLINHVSKFFEVEESKILGNSRSTDVVKGRYMLYLILHELYEYTYKDIAQYFQKDASNMKRQSSIIKEKNKEEFERLCHKLYNQLTTDDKEYYY